MEESLFEENPRVTGTEINYYFFCKRQLWFFTHNISMEQNSVDVAIGREVHEQSFEREHKEVLIDDTISLDFVGDKAEIHETKKGKKLDKGDKYQVLYYLYYLERKGIDDVRAVVHFPLYKQRIELYLDDEARNTIKEALKDIQSIKNSDHPEPPLNQSKCKRCSYYEICMC